MIDLHPATQRTIDLVMAVGDEQLGASTPCPDMTVGDLLDHIGAFAARFVAAARKESDAQTPPAPTPSADNLESGWRRRIEAALSELADAWQSPEAWQGTTYAGGRELPGEVAGLVVLDELVVHGWDLAVATGQAYDAPTPEVEAARSFVTAFDAPRTGRPFGPIVPVAETATPLDRLLGAAGRQPDWRPPA